MRFVPQAHMFQELSWGSSASSCLPASLLLEEGSSVIYWRIVEEDGGGRNLMKKKKLKMIVRGNDLRGKMECFRRVVTSRTGDKGGPSGGPFA